jgi:hypothetical protein
MPGAGGDGRAAPCQGGTGVSCTDKSFATNHSELHLVQLLAQNVQLRSVVRSFLTDTAH